MNQQTNYQKKQWIQNNPFSYLKKLVTQIPFIPQLDQKKITSLRDVYGQILTKTNYRDNLNNDVWIGKKPLSKNPIQISIQGFANTDHWVVMIQNKIYSLTTDNQWITGNIVIEIIDSKEKDNYDWSYFGQCYRDMEHIQVYVDYINSLKIKYKLLRITDRNLWDNCQFYAVQIAKFASSIGHENEIFLSGQNMIELERINYKNIDERSVLDFMKNKNILTFPQFRKQMNKDYLVYRDKTSKIQDKIQEIDPYEFKMYDQFKQDVFRANMIQNTPYDPQLYQKQ